MIARNDWRALIVTIEDRRKGGEMDGYREEPPPWAPADMAALDRQMAAEAECLACGRQGLEYRPFHNPAARSYRAYLVCPACRDSIEI